MNRILLTIFLCLLTAVAWAQGTVRGRVVEKQTNEGMEFANVRVLQGSKFIKGAISDSEGSFNITGLSYGTYTLQVTSIGFKEETRQFTLTQKNSRVTYPAVYMLEDAQSIGEVEVRGQRSQMRLEVDRKVFTVDQVLAAAGGAVTDLLESIPSIEVTTDGEISLRGNSSVEVWINGKASGNYGLNYTFTNAASNANAFVITARPASVQDMVLSDIIPGIKGKSGADISVTALDNAMEQARDKRAEVGIEFAVAQTILSVDAEKNLSLENQGMKQPPAMTPQEVAEQVHAQQGNGNGVAAQVNDNAGAPGAPVNGNAGVTGNEGATGITGNGAASNAGVTGAVNAAMDVVQQTDDAVGTEESKRKKGVA